jgi:hypothetical protein
MKTKTPLQEDFPIGSAFYIKEFDIPLVQLPDGKWENWFGGHPRPYDPRSLRVDNNWKVQSFEEWAKVISESYE